MSVDYVLALALALAGIAAGWAAKYGWDERDGGKRDQIAADAWEDGRRAQMAAGDDQAGPPRPWDDWDGGDEPGNEDQADEEYTEVLAAADSGLRAWEITGEGLAELPAFIHDREARDDVDPLPERPAVHGLRPPDGQPLDGQLDMPPARMRMQEMELPGASVTWLIADWDARAERRATITDQRAAAEFRVWEVELGGLIDSAYEWLASA